MFQYNSATAAGAIYSLTNVEFYAENTVFEGNMAFEGGAMSIAEGSLVTLYNCTCRDNWVFDTGDGGFVNIHDHSTLNMTSCHLERNSAWRGGACFLDQLSRGYGENNLFL